MNTPRTDASAWLCPVLQMYITEARFSEQLEIELAEAAARVDELEAEIRNAIMSNLNIFDEPITGLQGLANLVRLPEVSGATPGSESPS